MPLTTVITDAGRAALVDAAHDGTNAVRVAEIGVSATAHVPGSADTALPGEIKRLNTVSGIVVAGDIIHVTVQDAGGDAYAVRAFGLYLDDGTLFAIYGQADPILEKSTQAILLLAVDIAISDFDATMVTFGATNFIVPPATTDNVGVAELATSAETAAGADASRIVTPAGLLFAFTAWIAAATNIWRTDNDGSGSGLDADLLDGQHGTYYADVPARLGFTPLNATAYTAADVFAKVLTLDGAGSGLDADLLDGNDGAWYADIDARLGYTPLNSAAYTAADVFAKALTLDGSGSTLDADLLDGHHAADFPLRSDTSHSFGTSGWRVAADGFIDQWTTGAASHGSEDLETVYFPMAFPNACDNVQVTTLISTASNRSDVTYQPLSFFPDRVVLQRQVSGNDDVDTTPSIRALGH